MLCSAPCGYRYEPPLAALEIEQPGKLLRVCQEMPRESLQIFVGEKLNKFGDPQPGDSP